MEFHEKLQQLRKEKGLTQEQLAEALFVTRAAISKWESGRGYPNIDSLKAISAFFDLSIDALLSGDQILTIAETAQKEEKQLFRSRVFGLLDLSTLLLLFFPFFAQRTGSTVSAVSLLALQGAAVYTVIAYWVFVIGSALGGIVTFVLQKGTRLSLLWNILGVLLLMLGQHPYAAAFTFVFLVIKTVLLMKRTVSQA